MERPTKRPRLSFTPGSPEEVADEWDLQTARAQNDLRLKSIFEGIFTKYGKDFTEVGDEIDLETGKIVVDNGHLLGMREENDTGDQAWLYGNDADSEDDNQDPNEGLDEPQDEPEVPNKTTKHDELGESDSDSNDSILGSALPQPCSPKPVARLAPKVHPTLEQADNEPGPSDPLWQAPEIPRLFSTPTADRQAKSPFSPQLPIINREPSPPGSGSLWTVPRRGRPRTEGKPKATPSKRRPRAKPKSQSSPVAHDWSFAQRQDGDESDDPLQEFQPSPTPSRVTSIRGKPTKCPPFNINKRLETTQASGQSAPVTQDEPATIHDLENGSQDGKQDYEAGQNDTRIQAEDKTSQLQSDSSARSHMQGVRKPPSQNTPSKIYDGITPDEAKLIVRMRYLQRKSWQEILAALPGRKMSQVFAFNHNHWSARRKNPPQLSAPWSETELAGLERLKDQPGLSWPVIRAQMPGRSRAEIEHELMRLWVGDEVWFGEERGKDSEESNTSEQNEQVEDGEETEEAYLSEPQVLIPRPVVTEAPDLGPSTPGKKRPRAFEEALEEDDSDGAISDASSPSKLSAIYLDSPARSRQGSRTPSRASPFKRVKLAD